jgi:hypothetical protein
VLVPMPSGGTTSRAFGPDRWTETDPAWAAPDLTLAASSAIDAVSFTMSPIPSPTMSGRYPE